MNDNDNVLCRQGREGREILTFKEQFSAGHHLLSGDKAGARREKTYFRSPKAINRMKNSDNVRIFRQVVKAHFAIFEKQLSLESR